MFKINYDEKNDSFYFYKSSYKGYAHSDEFEGVIIDYTNEGKFLGIEILNASKVIKGFDVVKNCKCEGLTQSQSKHLEESMKEHHKLMERLANK